MERMVAKFHNWLKENDWTYEITEKKEKLDSRFLEKFHFKNVQYFEFIERYQYLISADETTWFLCINEYNGSSDSAFKWNEFEVLSLEAAEGDDDWKEEIIAWWDGKLPFIMSVRDSYSYYAIDLKNGGIVIRGEEPEFEEIEVMAESFEEFMEKLFLEEIEL